MLCKLKAGTLLCVWVWCSVGERCKLSKEKTICQMPLCLGSKKCYWSGKDKNEALEQHDNDVHYYGIWNEYSYESHE